MVMATRACRKTAHLLTTPLITHQMKLATSNTLTQHNLSGPSHFSIKKENMSHIIGILRSKIYSNKWLAVLREYLTNAVDAHIEAGIGDHPVQLTLPSLSSPKVIIRDFGKGLSEDDIREMYIMYGSSTKRQSNDYTGCLGIGCKAAFAYTDSFTITSYYEGKRSIYTAVIDDDSEGSVFQVDCSPTTESDGMEITVPVQTGDISNFQDEAEKILPYFDVMPTVTNDDWSAPVLNIVESGDRWRLKVSSQDAHRYHRNYGKATAVMGNIPYKLDSDKMGSDGDIDLLSCEYLIINFPLGSLDIAANRESLEYTTRTINNIRIEANRVLKDLANQMQKKLSLDTSLWAASCHALEVINSLPRNIATEVFDKMEFEGEKLRRNFKFPSNIVRHYRKHRYRAADYVNAKEDTTFVKTSKLATICLYDTLELSPTQATMRIRTLQANDAWGTELEYYAVGYDSEAKFNKNDTVPCYDAIPKKFLKVAPKKPDDGTGIARRWDTQAHLLNDVYVDLSKVEPYKPKRQKKNPDGTVTRAKINTCHLAPNHLASGRIIDTDELSPCAGKHVYIPLDRYAWHDKGYCLENDEFKVIENGTHMLHHMLDLPKLVIHGVKKHYLKALDDTWITLDEWYNQLYAQLKNKHRKAFALAANHQHHHSGSYGHSEHEVFKKLPKNLRFPNWEDFRTIREQWDYDVQVSNVNYISVHDDYTVEGTPNVSSIIHHVWLMFNPDYAWPTTIIEAHDKFIKAHPMMKYFESNWNTDTKEEVQDVKEYLTR